MPLPRFSAFVAAPALFVTLLTGGCSTIDAGLGLSDSSTSTTSSLPTTGLAVADEPLAAKTGASILSQGGSAADAVTAMFFTLSATYPVAAGLGGGGLCLLRDSSGRTTEVDFLVHRPNRGGPFAVPGAVRGFYDLQRSFGILPWQRVVSPGESYAATGFPISHALSLRLAAAQNVIRQDRVLAAEFLDPSGAPKAEGTVVANPALSETMGAVRLSGADGFYKGAVAGQIEAASGQQGGVISAAELAGTKSTLIVARAAALGPYAISVPAVSNGAGAYANTLLADMTRAGVSSDAAILAAMRQSLAAFGVSTLVPDMGATGFSAVDAQGQAAACAVTLNGPFGSGRTAGTTGMVLGASPAAPAGISTAFLTPVLASDGNGQVVLAGTGTGGPNGSAAVLFALLKMAGGAQLNRPTDLRTTGAAPYATVNVITCQSGSCIALPDPGANGLGAAADPATAPQ